MNDALYKKSFELFLKRTNEKSVIENFIHEHIPLDANMDILDIGAGEGFLATTISRKVKSTLVIEPNKKFCEKLLQKKRIKVLNEKWEAVVLKDDFDFILVAYVITYFPEAEREQLIKKMYDRLRPGGNILILSVDAKNGSWREIHTYFYRLMNSDHRSSDDTLKKIGEMYKSTSYSFTTQVIANNTDEMLEILGFDFYKYPNYFSKFSNHLKKFMKEYSDKNGRVTLEMVHNAYIITKH